jgi:hypothetical protein
MSSVTVEITSVFPNAIKIDTRELLNTDLVFDVFGNTYPIKVRHFKNHFRIKRGDDATTRATYEEWPTITVIR